MIGLVVTSLSCLMTTTQDDIAIKLHDTALTPLRVDCLRSKYGIYGVPVNSLRTKKRKSVPPVALIPSAGPHE